MVSKLARFYRDHAERTTTFLPSRNESTHHPRRTALDNFDLSFIEYVFGEFMGR